MPLHFIPSALNLLKFILRITGNCFFGIFLLHEKMSNTLVFTERDTNGNIKDQIIEDVYEALSGKEMITWGNYSWFKKLSYS